MYDRGLFEGLFSLCLVSSGPSIEQKRQWFDFDRHNKRKLYSAALATQGNILWILVERYKSYACLNITIVFVNVLKLK